MSDCKAYRHEIVEAPDGGVMSRGARAHAQACRPCGEELRQRMSLRVLVGGLGKVEAPADFDYRLRARMATQVSPGRRSPLRGLRLVYAFAPVAAAACFLVVSTSLYLRQASRPGPAESSNAGVSESARITLAERDKASTTGGEFEESEREADASKQTGGLRGEVASSRTPIPSRPAAQRSRASSRPSKDVAARREGLQRNTILASLTSAPVINGRGVTIALQTPAEPMRMILRDERGAGRVVPMRAVSFGSQELIARDNVRGQASAADNEGVW